MDGTISSLFDGMTCAACEATVNKVGGVVNISASTSKKNVVVSYDKRKTDIETIMSAIGSTGYKPVSYDDASGSHGAEGIVIKEYHLETDTKCGTK